MKRSAAYYIAPLVLVILIIIIGVCFHIKPHVMDMDVIRGFLDIEKSADSKQLASTDFGTKPDQVKIFVTVSRASVEILAKAANHNNAEKVAYITTDFMNTNKFPGCQARIVDTMHGGVAYIKWARDSYQTRGSVTFPAGAYFQKMKSFSHSIRMIINIRSKANFTSPVNIAAKNDDYKFFNAAMFNPDQSIQVSGQINLWLIYTFVLGIAAIFAVSIFQTRLAIDVNIPAERRIYLLENRYSLLSIVLAIFTAICAANCLINNSDFIIKSDTVRAMGEIPWQILIIASPLILSFVTTSSLAKMARIDQELEELVHTPNSADIKRRIEISTKIILVVTSIIFATVSLYITTYLSWKYSLPILISMLVLLYETPKIYPMLRKTYRTHTEVLDETWAQHTVDFLHNINMEVSVHLRKHPINIELDNSDDGMLIPYVRRNWKNTVLVSVKAARMLTLDELAFLTISAVYNRHSIIYRYFCYGILPIMVLISVLNSLSTNSLTYFYWFACPAYFFVSWMAEFLFLRIYQADKRNGMTFALEYTDNLDAAESAVNKITEWKSKTKLEYPEKEQWCYGPAMLKSIAEKRTKSTDQV